MLGGWGGEVSVRVEHGDCRDVVRELADCSIDACVTDPPYSLVSIQKRFGKPGSAPAKEGRDGLYRRASAGFMGQQWDTGEVAFDPAFWSEVLRVLKPGGHLVAFGGTRTYHRLACAIEDAGFEIRDQIGWCFGSGFPKSHNMGDGRGTALKPAWEPICLARKPLVGTVAENVLAHGTGAINIDGCRVEIAADDDAGSWGKGRSQGSCWSPGRKNGGSEPEGSRHPSGRWPANVILSYPEDEYLLRPDATREQKADLYRWMSENT